MLKKTIIGILSVLLLLMGGVFLLLPHLVDKDAIKSQFIASVKALTGFDVEISGDVVVETFPSPHIVINSVYVHNAPGGLSPFLASVKLVEIWPSYTSLLGRRASIGRINIDDADIELERLKNDQMNWKDEAVQTSPVNLSAFLDSAKAVTGAISVSMSRGYIHYVDQLANTSLEYKDISALFAFGGPKDDSTMTLNFTYRDKVLAATGKIGNFQQASSAGEVPANLSITSGKSDVSYNGHVGYRGEKFAINGDIKLVTDDLGSWISTIMGGDKQSPAAADKPAGGDNADDQDADKFKLLPLEMKASITTENDKIILPDVSLDGAVVKGGMRIEITSPYNVDIKAAIRQLDLEALFGSQFFAGVDEQKEKNDRYLSYEENADKTKEDNENKEITLAVPPRSLFNILNVTSDIKIDDTIYNEQHIRNAHVQLDSSNGEMTISQAVAMLPGETHLIFAGIGKEGFEGFTLEGELDVSGADFAQAIKVFKSNGASIPEQDFKRFHLKTNMIFSSKEFRMSEMAMRIENMAFLGGVIAKFGGRIKLNAALRVAGVNLDDFVKIWGIQEWRASLATNLPGSKYDSFIAQWLKRLDYDMSMNISLEQFTLNRGVRPEAHFKLTASSGKVALDNVSTVYNGSQISGSFALDVTGVLPKIDVKADIDSFDTAVFFTSDGKPLPAPTPQPGMKPSERWSREPIDFHWLDFIALKYHIKFGQYRQGLVTARNLDVQGGVDDRTFNMDSLTGTILGASVAAKLSITGGKIPYIAMAANIRSLESTQLLSLLPVLDGVSGKYNLSVRLDTSGVDMFSWASSLEGTVGLSGMNVNVHGFNLPGVIHAVAYVRTVADILNVVRRAFPGGDTLFNDMEGQWTVANGVFKIADARLTNKQATGLFTSQVDVINWRTLSIFNLALKELDRKNPPSMVITFSGDLDHPDISLDTRSLEQYVTNKTSIMLLNQYGTH